MVVENGDGLENANSYVTVEFADNYFSTRGIKSWADVENDVKEQILIKATDFVDNSFQWYGKKKNACQALRFPRVNLRDYEGNAILDIPTSLKQAVCEAAFIALNSELFQKANENGDVVSEKIGELSWTYSKNANTKSTTLYDAINSRLRGLYKDVSKTGIVTGKVERV